MANCAVEPSAFSNSIFVSGVCARISLPLFYNSSALQKSESDIYPAVVCVCRCGLRFHMSPDCRLENVVERCSYNVTGADFYALCSDAVLNAIARTIAHTDTGAQTDSVCAVII